MRNFYTVLLFIFNLTVFGQQTSLEYNIQFLQEKFKTTFSYDKNLVEGVNINIGEYKTIEDYIAFFNENTAFIFEKIDSSNILISPVEPGKNLSLIHI